MKNKPFILYVFIILAACFFACEKENPPEAAFTFESDSFEAGDTVFFLNNSSDAKSFRWAFGDGSVSVAENPNHIYLYSGKYNVTLTVENSDGTDEKTDELTITEPTILGFKVTMGDTDSVITNMYVAIFETENDLVNLENAVEEDYTDADGIVLFYHMKPIVYYVFGYKDVTYGVWGFLGMTQALTPNVANLYSVDAEFYAKKISGFKPSQVTINPEKINEFSAPLSRRFAKY